MLYSATDSALYSTLYSMTWPARGNAVYTDGGGLATLRGVAVMDPVRSGFPASVRTRYWGGLASTLLWVDPAEELIVLFFTQLIPSSTFNFRGQLEALVYAALD